MNKSVIKWSYFGCGCVLYDLLNIWFKGKFSITRLSYLVNSMHLERANLIFEDKNYKMFSSFHFIWVPFFSIQNMIDYYSCYIWSITKSKLIKKNKYHYLLTWPIRILFHYLLSIWALFKLKIITYVYIVRYYMLPLRHMAPEHKSFDSEGYYGCMTLAKLVILTKTASPHQGNEEFGQ